jgi:hypothetical protein
MKNLIEETHKIKLYGRSLKFYKNKGVDCKFGEIIEVTSSELCPESRVVVKCVCDECKKEFKVPFNRYLRCKKGFVCSHICQSKRTKKYLMERYGVENISQLNSVKIKKIKKSQENYNVDNISQSNIIKKKKANTSIEHFGVDNISKSIIIKNKKINTCRKNYGVDYPSQSKEIQNKYVETIQRKYGILFTNISQISEIMDKKIKTGISTKKYTLPSGKVVKIQGYENYGIEYLLKMGISEDDIIIGNKNIEKEIGIFMFYDMKKNKNRRYFPDIYVKSKNKIYEIKSNFTMNLNVDLIKIKKQSIIDRGFEFEFLIFNEKGVKI